MDRRSMLLGTGAALATRVAHAQGLGAAQGLGPRVFMMLNQDELDRAYDQSAWAPNAAAIVARYGKDGAGVRQHLPPRTESYGTSAVERLDVFAPPVRGRAPIHVFLHGGAWLQLTKEDASAPAATFVDAGGVYVAPDFANARAVRLPEMVEQCRRALRWVHAHAAEFGGDAGRITVSGHSSGAHLAAMMLTTDWTGYGLPADAIKGGLLMSGIYDLAPVVLSSRQSYLKLDAAEATALSPIRHLDKLRCPVMFAWGDQESPEFKRQGMVMADAVQGMGLQRSRHVLFNTNHFQVPEQLYRADTVLGRAALGVMGLA